MAKMDIKGSGNRGISFKGDDKRSAGIGGSGGVPVYIGARAVVTREPGGVKITLSDYKGKTEEIIAEAIQDVVTNPDGSLTFILPDGREITTESLSITDYDDLFNKPKINDVELKGNKTFADLGDMPLTNTEIKAIFDNIFNS